MKTLFLLLAVFGGLALCQATAQTDEPEVPEIPTEVSKPPYEVGQLVTESGYYIDRGEEKPKINLRIVANQFRLYWIDENGLIAEPESKEGSVHIQGSVIGRPYHFLSALPSGAGLGSAGMIRPPHIYNIRLVLSSDDAAGEPATYSFRYTADLDVETDPVVEQAP